MGIFCLALCFVGKKPNSLKMHSNEVEAPYFDILRIKKLDFSFWNIFFIQNELT